SVTSHGKAKTRAPREARSSRARSSSAQSRAQIATFAPSSANSRASTRPKPREPPVMSTVFPSKSYSSQRRYRARAAISVPAPAAARIKASLPRPFISSPPIHSHRQSLQEHFAASDFRRRFNASDFRELGQDRRVV